MTFGKMCDNIMQSEYLPHNILMGDEQKRQKDVKTNGTSKIYSKFILHGVL